MLEINPTVSMYTAFILHGRSPPWAVTSSVANKRFSGIMSLSPVNALIRVVLPDKEITGQSSYKKVSKGAKIRNQYNQVPHLTQDTNGKVTNSQ